MSQGDESGNLERFSTKQVTLIGWNCYARCGADTDFATEPGLLRKTSRRLLPATRISSRYFESRLRAGTDNSCFASATFGSDFSCKLEFLERCLDKSFH